MKKKMNPQFKVGDSVRILVDPTHSWLVVEADASLGLPHLQLLRLQNPHGHQRSLYSDRVELIEVKK